MAGELLSHRNMFVLDHEQKHVALLASDSDPISLLELRLENKSCTLGTRKNCLHSLIQIW